MPRPSRRSDSFTPEWVINPLGTVFNHIVEVGDVIAFIILACEPEEADTNIQLLKKFWT